MFGKKENFMREVVEPKIAKAIINVTRQTGIEEHCAISINAYELDRNEIFYALTEAAEALQLRVNENNKKAFAGEFERAVDPSKPLPKEFKESMERKAKKEKEILESVDA